MRAPALVVVLAEGDEKPPRHAAVHGVRQHQRVGAGWVGRVVAEEGAEALAHRGGGGGVQDGQRDVQVLGVCQDAEALEDGLCMNT